MATHQLQKLDSFSPLYGQKLTLRLEVTCQLHTTTADTHTVLRTHVRWQFSNSEWARLQCEKTVTHIFHSPFYWTKVLRKGTEQRWSNGLRNEYNSTSDIFTPNNGFDFYQDDNKAKKVSGEAVY